MFLDDHHGTIDDIFKCTRQYWDVFASGDNRKEVVVQGLGIYRFNCILLDLESLKKLEKGTRIIKMVNLEYTTRVHCSFLRLHEAGNQSIPAS